MQPLSRMTPARAWNQTQTPSIKFSFQFLLFSVVFLWIMQKKTNKQQNEVKLIDAICFWVHCPLSPITAVYMMQTPSGTVKAMNNTVPCRICSALVKEMLNNLKRIAKINFNTSTHNYYYFLFIPLWLLFIAGRTPSKHFNLNWYHSHCHFQTLSSSFALVPDLNLFCIIIY